MSIKFEAIGKIQCLQLNGRRTEGGSSKTCWQGAVRRETTAIYLDIRNCLVLFFRNYRKWVRSLNIFLFLVIYKLQSASKLSGLHYQVLT